MSDTNVNKPHTLNKIRKIDQDLETEFFKQLEIHGEDIPKAPYGAESAQADLINKDYE